MIKNDWKADLQLIATLFVAFAVLGWFFDYLLLALLLASLIYIGWSLQQFYISQQWLVRNDTSPPPKVFGLWRYTLNEVYFLRSEGQKEEFRLRKAIHFLEDSYALASDAVVLVDWQGQVQWCNSSSEYLLGINPDKSQGRNFIELLGSADFRRYFDAAQYRMPMDISLAKKPSVQLQLHVAQLGESGRLVFGRDVSHTHQLQTMRKDFVANASHELRTPLTVITGYLETIIDNNVFTDPRWKQTADKMLLQANRMENIIKGLIALSRIESMQDVFEYKPVDVPVLLQSLVDEANELSGGGRKIKFDYDTRLQLLGDAEQLRSAFANLIFNAVKYTQEGGCIEVEWFTNGSQAYLTVKDDGVGIEPEHVPRITERFYRTDKSRVSTTGGTGLGLAIVKHILINHQAELRVDSELGHGSCFTCIFSRQRKLRRNSVVIGK